MIRYVYVTMKETKENYVTESVKCLQCLTLEILCKHTKCTLVTV